MLVAKQINCEWRCACDAIKPFYEEALDLMARLRAHRTINTVALRHVYREYNADADGVCNQVLDLLHESARAIQVQVIWDSFCVVGQDGDTMMQLV